MAKGTILSRAPKLHPKWCNHCGVDLDRPIGLCVRCAKILKIDLEERWRQQVEAQKRHASQKRRQVEEGRRQIALKEQRYRQRMINDKKRRKAKRNLETFPRASDVIVTCPDGTTRIIEAYATPAALRRVAPERLPIPEEMRAKVLERDGHACRYCGNDKGPFHIDHVIPVALGGATGMSNLVTSCRTCNLRKGAAIWKPNPLPRRRRAA